MANHGKYHNTQDGLGAYKTKEIKDDEQTVKFL